MNTCRQENIPWMVFSCLSFSGPSSDALVQFVAARPSTSIVFNFERQLKESNVILEGNLHRNATQTVNGEGVGDSCSCAMSGGVFQIVIYCRYERCVIRSTLFSVFHKILHL